MPDTSIQAAPTSRRPFGQNFAFVVVAVIFLALLASAGLRATPGVLMLPLQKAFGWDVGVISSSAAVGIFLYGLAGPFAAAVMQRFGIRRTVLGALVLTSASTGASYFMTAPWQLFMSWGLLSGIGSGAVANVLGATIVNRWFTTNRGLVMGLLTASTATGTLIFMPGLAAGGADGGRVLRGADSAGVFSRAGAAGVGGPALVRQPARRSCGATGGGQSVHRRVLKPCL